MICAHTNCQIAPSLRTNPTLLNMHIRIHPPRRPTGHIHISSASLSTNSLLPLNHLLSPTLQTPRSSIAQTRPTRSIQYQLPLPQPSPFTFNNKPDRLLLCTRTNPCPKSSSIPMLWTVISGLDSSILLDICHDFGKPRRYGEER